jgi:hypothetical protein
MIQRITSKLRKHARYSGSSAAPGSAEDIRDRQFINELREYYDAITTQIRGAEAFLLIGPGKAKHELRQFLQSQGVRGKIDIEAADKLTDPQIAALVRRRFGG